jgi:hypothetical protein
MAHKFTKSDEGKYLFYSAQVADNYFELFSYIIKVSDRLAVYRYFFFVHGMKSDNIKADPDIHRWKYAIVNVDDNNFPSDTTYSYPLRLVMLGCPFPKRDLTRQEREKMIEFEQGKDVSEWLHTYNYGQSSIIERTN